MARFRNIFPNELHFKKLTLNPPMTARVAWGFLHSLSFLINFNTFLLKGNDRVFNSDAHENDSNCYQVSNLMMPQRLNKPIVLLADKKATPTMASANHMQWIKNPKGERFGRKIQQNQRDFSLVERVTTTPSYFISIEVVKPIEKTHPSHFRTKRDRWYINKQSQDLT